MLALSSQVSSLMIIRGYWRGGFHFPPNFKPILSVKKLLLNVFILVVGTSPKIYGLIFHSIAFVGTLWQSICIFCAFYTSNSRSGCFAPK